MKRCVLFVALSSTLVGCTRQQESARITATTQRPTIQGEAAGPATTSMDQDFMREAALGGRMEIELGRLATRYAASPEVRRFGERMVREHSRANQRLTDIANRMDVSLPQQLEGRHRELTDQMADMRGPQFDRMYMRQVVDDHEKDVAKFRQMSEQADDIELRVYASETLPTLEEHLKLAREVGANAESMRAAEGQEDRSTDTRPAHQDGQDRDR